MKKELIESKELSVYMDAMNGKNGIVCELKHPNPLHNEPCRIDEIRSKPGKISGAVDAYIDVTVLEKNEKVRDCRPESILLYNREFEDGDYVMQACGDIVICAGMQNGKYILHAAMDRNGYILYPDSNFHLYGFIMPGDRLCTDKEMMKINGALEKEGKFFDPVEGKLVDSVFKKNHGLFEKFKKDWERYKRDNADDNADDDADDNRHGDEHDDEHGEFIVPSTCHLSDMLLPHPICCLRGVLHTMGDVIDVINVYEDRIEELTAMCNEVYAKMKEQKSE